MRINYAAIVVSSIIYWLLGALWFGMLFSKPWMELEGSTAMTAQYSVIATYAIAFLAGLVLIYVLAQVALWREVDTVAKGASLGVLFWIGFVCTTALPTYLFENRSWHLFLINYGYCLVGMVIAGAILGGWKKKTA